MLRHPLACCIYTLVLTAVCANAHAASAARVEFVAGRALAVDANGKERELARGSEVTQGDTVDTKDARVQLRFSDGAFVSLQPQTRFRIDQYRYEGRADGNERGIFSLLQGGLRTITGLVGRTNKRNYQVNTSVATIGIRGTEYTAYIGAGLTGSVGEGQIAVCNAGGCTNVTNGESFFVPTADIKPAIISKKTDLPPTQPQPPAPTYVAGDATTGSGTIGGVQFTGSQTLTLGYIAYNCLSACSIQWGVSTNSPVVFATDGSLSSAVINTSLNYQLSGVTETGNNGVVAWGRGVDTSGQPFHYVTGLPTAATDLSQLAISTPVATYSVIGATSPSSGTGANQLLGQFQGATLTARFASGVVDATVQFGIAGSTAVASVTNMPISAGASTFSGAATGANACAGTACNTSAYVSMNGFIAGQKGSHAGLVYSAVGLQSATGATLASPVSGAVAFQRAP